jgi:hypothetical protein
MSRAEKIRLYPQAVCEAVKLMKEEKIGSKENQFKYVGGRLNRK